jgi:PBP1b-binding outer membrane lipoprotein LpoB
MRQAFVFRAIFTMSLLAGVGGLTGCSKPKVPDHDDPPEPQAAAVAQPTQPTQPTQLREAMQKPIDKAEAAQGEVDAAAERQRAAIDAATGG